MEIFGEGSDLSMVLRYREVPEDPETVARNRQTLLTALDAVAAGDAEGFWSIFDPEVVFHEAPCLPHYGGEHRGLAATQAAFARLNAVFSRTKSVFETVLAGGDLAILYQTITFEVRANGNTGVLPVSELFRFRNGKVIEWRALYFDSAMMAQAIAGPAKA
jgi:ketosteroid isomerase-like protein